MATCPSRCYDNGGRVAGSDAQTNNFQAARTAVLQCAPCETGDGVASFAVNGRINLPGNISYWSLNSTTESTVDAVLPYVEAGEFMQGQTCWIAPFRGTLSRFVVRVDIVPTADTRTFTILLARPGVSSSTATTLAVSFLAGGVSNTLFDDVDTVDFEIGDLLSMRVSGDDADATSCTYSVIANAR